MKTIKILIIAAVIAISFSFIPIALAGHHGCHYGYSIGIGVPLFWGYDYWGPYPYYYDPYPYYPSPVYVPGPVVVERPVVLKNEAARIAATDDFRDVRARKVQLLAQLNQGTQVERLQAIDGLAGFSFDEQVRAALENVLVSDPNTPMRIEAAWAFAKVKNPGALPILEKVRVDDPERDVREAADRAIKQIKS